MKMKPTRFTGWAGKNLADLLPTRRRGSTTTHDTDGVRRKHVARIKAPDCGCQTAEAGDSLAAQIFSASQRDGAHPFSCQTIQGFAGCLWARHSGWRWRSGTCSLPSLSREILWRYSLM